MKFLANHKILSAVGIFLLLLLIGLIIELLIIRYNGKSVPAPDIPRQAETYGSGPALSYAVFGDSTTVSQGGAYDSGIARGTARHIAEKYTVTLRNFGISGARAEDVVRKQIPQAADFDIDVALLCVTANDVTHLTSISKIRADLEESIAKLRSTNPNIAIVLTGSPQMGSVPRFPDPIKSLARVRVSHINAMVREVVREQNVVFAPVADKTGKVFLEQPELFAADKFHPTTEGYNLWIPVINDALDRALPLLRK